MWKDCRKNNNLNLILRRKVSVMKVSAVGFLFRESVKNGTTTGENYTCVIHKIKPDGNYSRNIISSPIIKKSSIDTVSPQTARANVNKALIAITDKNASEKFVGATIKDGIKETEVHSLLSDKLFAVRTKDIYGENHFDIMGKDNTQKLLAKNLYA